MKKYKSVIGVNIDRSSIKCAQMVNLKGALTLIKISFVRIETNPVRDETTEISNGEKEKMERNEATAVALKKVLADFGTKSAKIVCTVNNPQISIVKIFLPVMPGEELFEAVKWEMKSHISFPLDNAVIDFNVLGEVEQQGVKKMNVMAAAVNEESIKDLLGLFIPLGLKVSTIIPMSMAHENLIKEIKKESEETIAVVEMGEIITELNIYRNASLEFTRKFPIAGVDLTKSLTAGLVSPSGPVKLSMEEAEKIKKEYGIPRGETKVMIEGKISNLQVLALIRPKIEQLAKEIDRSFDFYREQYGGKVEKIILFGGSVHLKGLVEFLTNELAVKVEIGNALNYVKVLSGVEIDSKLISHRLDLAIGAALDRGKGINLLPSKGKEDVKRLVTKFSLTALITIEVMLLFFFGVGMFFQAAIYERKLDAVKMDYKILIPQVHKLRQQMLLEQTLQDRPHWEEILKEMSNIVPSNMYFIYLGMENNVVNLKGVIKQSSQPAEKILSVFMLKLEEGILKNVRLVEMKRKGDELQTSEFEIEFHVE